MTTVNWRGPMFRKLHGQGASAFLCLFLIVPLSVLLVPVLIVGSEKEVTGDGIKICEELFASSESKRVRDHREKHHYRPWLISRSPLSRPSNDHCNFSLVGHRLKHDLMAPLTC